MSDIIDTRIISHHVGGRGFGVSFNPPQRFSPDLVHVLYEADEESYRDLAENAGEPQARHLGEPIVLPYCLGASKGAAKLNVTANAYASSLYPPNEQFFKFYCELFLSPAYYDVTYEDMLEVAKKVDVTVHALDDLFAEDKIPVKALPDFLSLDTQGMEHEIMQGAARTIKNSVLGVVTEIEFMPMYVGQPLFADILKLMDEYGFYFAGYTDLYEVSPFRAPVGLRAKGFPGFGDALFLRKIESLPEMCPTLAEHLVKLNKLAFIALNYGHVEYAINALAETRELDLGMAAELGLDRRQYYRFLQTFLGAAGHMPRDYPQIFGVPEQHWPEGYTPSRGGWYADYYGKAAGRFDRLVSRPEYAGSPIPPVRPGYSTVESVLVDSGFDAVADSIRDKRVPKETYLQTLPPGSNSQPAFGRTSPPTEIESEASAPSESERPPFFFIVTFWGKRYRDWFLRFALPSLLAPNNIPALDDLDRCRFLISTTQEDWDAIQDEPAIKMLRRLVEVEFFENEERWPDEHKYNRMSNAHRTLLSACYAARACAIYFACDTLIPDGCLSEAQRLIREGKRVILCTAIRFDMEGVERELNHRNLLRQGEPLVLPRRDAASIGLRCLHRESQAGNFDADNFGALNHAHGRTDFATCCYFEVSGEDGIVIHTHNWAPFAIDFSGLDNHDTTIFDKWAIDGDYIYKNFGTANVGKDIHVVEDSDSIILVGLTPGDEMVPPEEPGSVKSLPLIGYWVKGFILNRVAFDKPTDPLRRKIYPIPVRWHAGDINANWQPVETRARKVIGTFTTRDLNLFRYIPGLASAISMLALPYSRLGRLKLRRVFSFRSLIPRFRRNRHVQLVASYLFCIIGAILGDPVERMRIRRRAGRVAARIIH